MADMDIYEGAFTGPQIDNILGNSTRQDSIAIVSNNNTHIAITAGQYVYVKNHGTLSEGMYKANSNISANGTLTSSNLTAVSNGVANELKSAIIYQDSINLGQCSTLSALESALDTALSDMTSGQERKIRFTITGSITGFDTTTYSGFISSLPGGRAWVMVNTAFNYLTVGAKASSWVWRRVTLQSMS